MRFLYLVVFHSVLSDSNFYLVNNLCLIFLLTLIARTFYSHRDVMDIKVQDVLRGKPLESTPVWGWEGGKEQETRLGRQRKWVVMQLQ